MIERSNEENKKEKIKSLNLKKKCELLNVPRSSMYYKEIIQDNSSDKEITDKLRVIYERHAFYGYRRMTVELRKAGVLINHKKVYRLLKEAGIQAIYPKKITTIRNLTHKVFPYLLRNMKIERPNQVWQVDITYIKVRGHFVYLICLIDIFSRKIMGWNFSNSLDTLSCLEALGSALQSNVPEIINSDQGCQFTSELWVNFLQEKAIFISMDGKGRWADNVYIERLWRTIKYEFIHLHSFENLQQARDALALYIDFYNKHRPHQSLNYHTPDDIFAKKRIPTKQELLVSFVTSNFVDNIGTNMI